MIRTEIAAILISASVMFFLYGKLVARCPEKNKGGMGLTYTNQKLQNITFILEMCIQNLADVCLVTEMDGSGIFENCQSFTRLSEQQALS